MEGPAARVTWPLTSVVAMEENMRIGRAIILPAVLALSVAGPVLSVPGMALATANASSVHVQSTVSSATPDVFYRS